MVEAFPIHDAVHLCQKAPGKNKLRITSSGLVEQPLRLRQLLPGEDGIRDIGVEHLRPQVEIVRLKVTGGRLFDASLFRGREFCLKLASNGFGYLTLDRENVDEIAIITLSPEVCIVACIDQLCVHTYFGPGPLHAAFQKMSNTEGLANLMGIARNARLILHHRTATNHLKISNSGEVCQDFILHAISKESVFGILAEVFEWKDSNTLDRDYRKIADSFLMKNRVADGERDDCKQ